MLVIVVEDVVVPVVTTLLDCDAMPHQGLADLLLVRVKPQLMVILDQISKAVQSVSREKARKDISGEKRMSTVLEILTAPSGGWLLAESYLHFVHQMV